MSTNKTENYQLHSWEADDDFSRQEINENFAVLDEAVDKATIVTGTYTSDGADYLTVSLGFRPAVVLIFDCRYHISGDRGQHPMALAIEGAEVPGYVQLTDEGFKVSSTMNYRPSSSAEIAYLNPYRYIAWK